MYIYRYVALLFLVLYLQVIMVHTPPGTKINSWIFIISQN